MGKYINEMVDYKVDILAIGVHPDDIELSCAGTILKQIDEGNSVAILDLTQGELGSRGSGPLRLKEAEAARKVMGVKFRSNLEMADGFFEHDKRNILLIVEQIRKYRPQIILANAIRDRHPDHGRAAKLISDAVFISGLIKVETYSNGQIQEKWRPDVLYHYIQDFNLRPDFVVDITGYFESKMKAIFCYSSQFYDPKSKEVNTPISGEDFLDFIRSKASTFGREIGVKHGEGFTVFRVPGVDNLFNLK